MTMIKRTPHLPLLLGLGALLALGACREQEQDRVLLFDKGEYLGEADATLPADAAATLRQRAAGQQF